MRLPIVPISILFNLTASLTCGAVGARDDSPRDLAAIIEMSRKNYSLAGLTYRTVQGVKLNMDAFRPRAEGPPLPTLVYFHGGGWMTGDKERAVLHVTPFVARGWAAFNVEYRLGTIASAPAAVEDCICALKWIRANAAKYRVDVNRVVLMGHSAGGHLALISGFAPELGAACPGEIPKIRVVVNWYGISDVADVVDGPNRKEYAEGWVGSSADRIALATRLSPLHYVHPGLPAVVSIHGDKDDTVPFSQSERLDVALRSAGVPSLLIRIPGAKHGQFSEEQYFKAYQSALAFVDLH